MIAPDACTRIVAVLALGVALFACARHEPRATTAAPQTRHRTVMTSEPVQLEIGDTPWLAPDPMFACMQDDDCAVLEMGCCDHCNGGWKVSVNTRHADDANRRWAEVGCDTACTALECPETLAPVCDGGVCARREVDPDATGQSRMTIVRNVLPPG